MAVRIDHARPEDAHELVLREEDDQEVQQYGFGDHQEALALSISWSPDSAFSARDPEGRLIALFGASRGDGTVSPWLLCSDLVERYPASVWRIAKRVVAQLQVQADAGAFVFNHIAKSSTKARAFVQALGFRIVQSPVGPFDLFFLPPSCVSTQQP